MLRVVATRAASTPRSSRAALRHYLAARYLGAMDAMATSSCGPSQGKSEARRGIASSANATDVTTHNQYKTDGMDEAQLSPSAIAQFRAWFAEATAHEGVAEPEAMVLGTADVGADGLARPSSRVVLLKRIDERGLVFYSNYTSRKGRELAANPWASLTFYWHAMHRSVRVGGRVEQLSHDESMRYFNSRPLGSRVGAIASPQSQPIPDRATLENRVRAAEQQHGIPGAAGLDGPVEDKSFPDDKQIPVPDYWGGYRVVPNEVEFWMGRSNRLHDRFRYTRGLDSNHDTWSIDRLAP